MAAFLFSLTTIHAAAKPQLTTPTQASEAPQNAGPVFEESLRPALAQVGSALNQVRIDRWKLSSEWKDRLRGDADSIQNDMRVQLPSLFQTAQQSPSALGPQWAVIQNVNALYDVLVRISTAANFSGRKDDAILLGDALATLETARKAVSKRLLQDASLQDKLVVQLHARQNGEPPAGVHPKTIVVDNRVSHKSKSHKTQPHK